ncbi:protein xmas-2 [Leptopilina heterotoma]|uniref:protein xmas-2 n=1 Tax=Leptopilina heterotoma TaxID=63436 RepID=UPI001CA8564C|nr:protein xmas-2 [Leptopilina heterotoma]
MENENNESFTTGNEDNEEWRKFTFSPPNIVHNSERIINFGITSDHVISPRTPIDDEFQFSLPTNLFKNTSSSPTKNADCQSSTKQYKPRISRNTFKAPVNVFTQALKGSHTYEQLKKNTKSQQQKNNIENSITCTMVPKSLLDKVVAKEHFSTFGDISKILIRPKKQSIVVFYVTKGEANIAYYKCGLFLNEKFNVQWTNEVVKSPVKKADTSTVSRILKANDDSFQDEIEALKHLEYNLHEETPTEMKQLTCITKLRVAKPKELKHDKVPSRLDKVNTAKVEKIGASVPKATVEELQYVIRQAALTSEDKYKILEARDKLMRLRNAKSISLATAQITRGTCPDMCPEKERLMRETQRQVSFYEQSDNNGQKINHMTAVKQYSRSSADQEEPMPHELRPVKSLKMTMSYLLHEIVDLCERKDTNLAEWYHFLWDRTRGIRKDITQQELCCPDSVELVEQCARFHILSSERLCTEESNVFDKKINTENLTKCLQTLKYMYNDLMLKGISCINEPEFRAYIILLNLNNGSFMWDLQKLPSSIQKSPEVKFAIEVYSSIVSNNYVKFFKLLRRTTYMNASILLRYFNQVRITALSVMVKAYCRTITKPYPYPLYELIDILAFEDEREAVYFCEQVGLSLSQDELYVMLNREHFASSEHTVEQARAFNVIESKRHARYSSVGQCIAGGSLPGQSYKNHQPHDSFDSQGYLLEESLKAEDQKVPVVDEKDPYEFTEDVDDFSPEVSESPEVLVKNPFKETYSANKRKLDFNPFCDKVNDSTKTAAQTTFSFTNSVKKPFTSVDFSKSSFQTFATENKTFAFSNVVNKDIFSGSTKTSPFKSVQPVKPFFFHAASAETPKEDEQEEEDKETESKEKILQQEEEAKQKRKEQEEAKLRQIEAEAENLYLSHLFEVVDEICGRIIKAELQILYQAWTEDIFENILQDIVQETCEETCREEKFIQEAVSEIRRKQKRRISDKYYKLWRRYVNKKRSRRKALDNTPIWLPKQSLEACAKSLYCKQQDAVIENMCRKRLKLSPSNHQPHNQVPIEVVIYAGIKENIKSFNSEPRICCPNMFWKLAISWPKLENRVVLYQRKKVISGYFSDEAGDPIMKNFQPNAYETLHVCIRNFEGVISEENLTGMDALMFIASTSEESRSIVRRLTKTVLSKNKLMPIPLVVILFHDGNIKPEAIDITPDLENLMDTGFVSEYTIILENTIDENAIVKLTQSAVLWLAVNKSPQVPLEMDYLKRVLKDCLMEELWFRLEGHSVYNSQLKNALEDPQFVINLHTEAITHVMEIILDQESLLYTDFSPEIKGTLKENFNLPCSYEYFDDVWKNVEYRETVERFVKQLIIPQWRESWPIYDKTHLQKAIRNFCIEAMADCSHDVSISDILNNLFVLIDSSPRVYFPDILLLIINKKIDLMKEELKVVYNRNHIKHFRTLPWWFKSTVFLNYSFQPLIDWEMGNDEVANDSRNISASLVDESDMDDYMDQSLTMNHIHPVKEISKSSQSQMTAVFDKLETFGVQLQDQKLKNQQLEDEIKKALFPDES